tara:strand:+ start:1373 stop:2323 length:951 start_codon:yes stop_codon:yes gene_type:complete
MKKILITGAAGFLGYHLLNKIINKNFKFILLDNFIRGKKDKVFKSLLKNKKVKLINHDLTKPLNLKEKNIKYIFHFAAHLGVENVISKPSKTINENLQILINTISALKSNNHKAKFIFFSTSEVYSPLIKTNIAKFPLKEDVDLMINKETYPRDSYYLSKIVGEKIVQLSGFDYLCLRPHNVYGPRMGYSHVIPELIKKIIFQKNKKIKIYSPSHKRAFCYIDDAIEQIVRLSFSLKIKNQIFNIGNSREEIKIFDLAKIIKSKLKSKKKLIKYLYTSGSPKRRVPNMSKTNFYIKKRNYISLNKGIQSYINWYKG